MECKDEGGRWGWTGEGAGEEGEGAEEKEGGGTEDKEEKGRRRRGKGCFSYFTR